MEKAGPFIGHPASGGQGVTWSRAHLLEGAGLGSASPWDLCLPQGPHLMCACAYICMCVCVCLHTPWGPCDFWDLCLPHSPHLTRACVCTCAHACTCVCACTCPRLPFFLLPRDVTTSRGLCLQREWGRSLVLPTDSLPPSSQKGVNEQKPDDSGWKSTVCV